MKPKYQACFDVDDTLYPLSWNFAKIVRRLRPDLPRDFERDFLTSEFYKLRDFKKSWLNGSNDLPDDEKVLRVLGSSPLFFEPAYAGARNLCNAVYDTEGLVQVITNRGLDGNPDMFFRGAYRKTKEWLDENELRHEDLVLTENKLEQMRRLEEKYKTKFRIAVNDSLEESAAMVNAMPYLTVLLLNRVYNRDRNGEKLENRRRILRVHNLEHATSLVRCIAREFR